uniref:TIGR00725 family protein n=1 Tax=candidate division WOR-3 bacterium TaxID=2052148 RepID=A0A7V5Y0A6_UNCW3
MKKIIGVIGGSTCSEEIYNIAYQVGRHIAKKGYLLISGGLGGVMEAACKGAKSEQGLTIGILPTNDKNSANPYVDIPIVTGMGEARNIIIVKSADGIIAIDGGYGTLSELAFCGILNLPVVLVKSWDIGIGIKEDDPEKAVDLLIELMEKKH